MNVKFCQKNDKADVIYFGFITIAFVKRKLEIVLVQIEVRLNMIYYEFNQVLPQSSVMVSVPQKTPQRALDVQSIFYGDTD